MTEFICVINMVKFICKSCGYTTNEENAKFCQTCGSALEPVKGENCPKCNAPIAPQAQFCSKCGASLEAAAAPPAAAAPQAQSQPQASTPGVYRDVTGPILKAMPIAHYHDRGARIVGAIKLCRDGLRFAALNGERINCPVEAIAQVTRGSKTDILDVQMKDGKVFTFQVMGGKKWLEVFQGILR